MSLPAPKYPAPTPEQMCKNYSYNKPKDWKLAPAYDLPEKFSPKVYYYSKIIGHYLSMPFYTTCTNQALRIGQGENDKGTEIKSKDVLSMSHCQSLRSIDDEQRQDKDDLPSVAEVSHNSI